MTLETHFDKGRGHSQLCWLEGLASDFLQTARKHNCKYIARKKGKRLAPSFPGPKLLAETIEGQKENSLSHLYRGEDDPPENFIRVHTLSPR